MLDYGTIKSIEIGNDLDSENKRYIVGCEFSDEDDIRKVQIINIPGINVRPRIGNKVLSFDVGGPFELGIVVDDNIDSNIETDGEIELHAIDENGEKKSSIKNKTDGTLEVNGNADFAVAYNDLKTAFDQLKSDHDDLVSKHNSHIHTTTATIDDSGVPGTISPTTTTGSPSTADMSPSKVDSVKLP